MVGLMFTSVQGSPGPHINNRLTCLTRQRSRQGFSYVTDAITVNPFKTAFPLRLLSFRPIVKADSVKKKREFCLTVTSDKFGESSVIPG